MVVPRPVALNHRPTKHCSLPQLRVPVAVAEVNPQPHQQPNQEHRPVIDAELRHQIQIREQAQHGQQLGIQAAVGADKGPPCQPSVSGWGSA